MLGEFIDAGKTYQLGSVEALAALLRSAPDILKKRVPVSLKGTNFDIRTMGEAYKDYYSSI